MAGEVGTIREAFWEWYSTFPDRDKDDVYPEDAFFEGFVQGMEYMQRTGTDL